MADSKVVAVSEMSAELQKKPISSHLDLKLRVLASKSMLNKESMNPSESEEESICPLNEKEESFGEDDDGGIRRPGKKRRLTVNQVKNLEKHFEVENKLEPERKVGLAKELGLQPRQVAIWFQNRRARLKTKQLEKDYGSLKPNYDKLMADYVNLLKQNEDLKTKINEMKEESLKREKRRTKMGNLEQVEAMAVQVAELESLLSNSDSNPVCNLAMATRGKQGEASSDKSDTFDSESPFNTENHSSFMEAGNSAQSNFSQNEEDDFTKTLVPQFFPKLEEEEEFSKSCVFGFPDDEQKFCFWPYFSSEI